MASNTSPYKPSPLSFGSPRTSPFRRPSAASSPTSHTARAGQPASPSSRASPGPSPSKLNKSHTAGGDDDDDDDDDDDVFSASPGERNTQSNNFSAMMSSKPSDNSAVKGDALTKLPPGQVREMREAFQVLDRDNDGQVNRDDVVDMLGNLGQDSSAGTAARYFPPGAAQNINLPGYLNKLASLISPLSSSQELLNAFAAFDEDDSGQIDLAELRDALLHTNPESDASPLTEREIDEAISGFTGRRAFGGRGQKSSGPGGRGEVFRYREFVGSLSGGKDSNGANKNEPADVGEG